MRTLTMSRCCLYVLATLLCCTAVMAQLVPGTMQAVLKRSTTGRGFERSGMASLSVPLSKGAIYDVVRQENGGVVLKVNGLDVLVQTDSVLVTEKTQMAVANSAGFVPGKVVLISAKYTLDGNQPRNVKNNLQKLIPQTNLSEPLEIIVTDALSSAALDQGQSQTTIVITGNGAGISMNTPSKNVLTVQYLYNGQRFTKQVPEGGKLVLP